MTKLSVAYTDDYLNWQLGNGDGSHPTNPIRAKLATAIIEYEITDDIEIFEPEIDAQDRDRLADVHSEEHIANVLDKGVSFDWTGERPDMGETALLMFAGTARLVEKMLAGETQVGFNPQGAKHHAQRDWSEGFCVFNDMAWAAREFARNGLKVAYIDWDVNAGDGVQNLLEDTDIPTFSIHGHGIYPTHSDTWSRNWDEQGNYEYSNPSKHWYNWCLQPGEGDDAFAWAIDQIAEKMDEYKPDVILLATGADGHEGEYWGLKYTYKGYEYAAKRVAEMANKYAKGRVLIGGAGGYQPYTHTPRVWATVVKTIHDSVERQ